MSNKIQNLLEQAYAQDSNRNSVSFAKHNFTAADNAQTAFTQLREKLLNLENWNEHSGLTSYELFDKDGNSYEDKTLKENAFIRIYLKASGKYDWVQIIEIYDSTDEFVITVNPTFDPTDRNSEKDETSHFFSSEATNNFCLLRDDKSLTFYVIGLNEKQNVEETDNPIETVRNVAVANLGSYLGIQTSEWTKFCESFLSSVIE